MIRLYSNNSSKSDLFWEDLLTQSVIEEAGTSPAKGMLSQGPRSKQCRNKGRSEEYIKVFQNCLKIFSTEKKGGIQAKGGGGGGRAKEAKEGK